MKKIWIDPDLIENKSGIGRDAQLMLDWIDTTFDSEILEWPTGFSQKTRIRRLLLLLLRVSFGVNIHLPKSYRGAFYQSQLGPLLPGKGMDIWLVRLHDLFPATNPEWFHWWSIRIFKQSLDLAIARDAIFLCDSRSTQLEINRLYPDLKVNSYVIPCQLPAVSPAKCGNCSACKNLHELQKEDYVLSVGTVEPRKNYLFALIAWRDLKFKKENNLNLIIVGRPGWKTRKLQKQLRNAATSGVVWIPHCCDGTLDLLYKKSRAFISFSLAEGFDMPAMEARQKYQVPLILSDISVHREFHDDVAQFFKSALELKRILRGPLRQTSISHYSIVSQKSLEELKICLNLTL
jgi:glycosyltransferase involved in cell wall biosynthesis